MVLHIWPYFSAVTEQADLFGSGWIRTKTLLWPVSNTTVSEIVYLLALKSMRSRSRVQIWKLKMHRPNTLRLRLIAKRFHLWKFNIMTLRNHHDVINANTLNLNFLFKFFEFDLTLTSWNTSQKMTDFESVICLGKQILRNKAKFIRNTLTEGQIISSIWTVLFSFKHVVA